MVALWHRWMVTASAYWRAHKRTAAMSTVYLLEALALMAVGGVITVTVLRAWA